MTWSRGSPLDTGGHTDKLETADPYHLYRSGSAQYVTSLSSCGAIFIPMHKVLVAAVTCLVMILYISLSCDSSCTQSVLMLAIAITSECHNLCVTFQGRVTIVHSYSIEGMPGGMHGLHSSVLDPDRGIHTPCISICSCRMPPNFCAYLTSSPTVQQWSHQNSTVGHLPLVKKRSYSLVLDHENV